MNADLTRREFIVTTSSVLAGWMAGFRPVVPDQYVLSLDIDENAIAGALKIHWGNVSKVLDPDKGLLMNVPVAVDTDALWNAVTVMDQHGDVWKIEGTGQALISPWGERFELENEH